MTLRILCTFLSVLMSTAAARAQLKVAVQPAKVVGQKAVVPLNLRNDLSDQVESARAVVFLLDEQGKMIGRGTRWVIGGTGGRPGLSPGATNTFHFVVTGEKPFSTTNLTTQVSFTRVVLEGGKLANPRQIVKITEGLDPLAGRPDG